QEYEAMMTSRPTSFPPPIPRSESVDYQRWYGEAYSLIDTAELAFFGALARFAEKCVGFAERAEAFTTADDGALATSWRNAAGWPGRPSMRCSPAAARA